MDRKTKGRLAEIKVISYLVENEYEIYLPFSGNSKYDVIAIKNGVLKRISVKFTSVKKPSGAWSIELRQISRRNQHINIDKFNNKDYDLVAAYIGPIDKVVLIDSSKVKTRGLDIKV